MNNKQIDIMMKVVLSVSAILIVIGALSKLEHYPNGSLILTIGFGTFILFSSIEIYRLRRIIKKLESQKTENI